MPHWTPGEMPDLTGRVAVVTGASSGIGFHTALEFARHGARTLLACRTPSKAENVLDRIVETVPAARGSVELVQLDLASLDSVEDAAADLADRTAAIDILVNNAGVMAPGDLRTAEGFELQFGVNHLGHFAFTGRVLPLLLAASSARVVTVSSLTHKQARPVWGFKAGPDGGESDPAAESPEHGRYSAYGRSKLANLVFARELDRRAKRAGAGLVSVAAHPGYAATELMGKTSVASRSGFTTWLTDVVVRLTGQSPASGAWPSLYAATRTELTGGEYIGPRGPGELRGAPGPARMSPLAYDETVAGMLWDGSVGATGVGYEEFELGTNRMNRSKS